MACGNVVARVAECSQNNRRVGAAVGTNKVSIQCVVKRSGAMHVARIKSSHVDKAGRRRDYQSVYLRRSYRDGAKTKHEKLANLSALPDAAITAIEAVLAGPTMVPALQAVRVEASPPHR